MAKAKPVCPVGRKEFLGNAERLTVKIGEDEMKLVRKQFAGDEKGASLGWGHQGRVTLKVNDVWVEAYVGINITLMYSKDLPPLEE